MNVLIVGDSWGVSLYPTPEQPKFLEFDFIEEGHTVFNKSIYGGQNMTALNTAEIFLESTKESVNVDIIIWYYTCLMRDNHLDKKEYIGARGHEAFKIFLDSLEDMTATYARNIKDSFPNCRWVIVGGHASIYKPELYNWADVLIEDYRSDILGYNVPNCQTLGHVDEFDHYKEVFGTEVLLEETEKTLLIDEIGKNRTDIFWDGVHINAEYSNQLSKRILKSLE